MALRLDKYLTELGAGTRSEVKKQIKAGLVTVNGAVAKKPEQKVDETGDEVCLRGERLLYTAFEYYLFHKPAGCVSATQDNMHRTVMDYLSDTARGDLFPVGRLDLDTEGLLFDHERRCAGTRAAVAVPPCGKNILRPGAGRGG